ncbi:MAG: SRPBCC family protein [Candidatus Dormiibacterota bacterium]
MPHAEHRVTIKRPAADVFSYLADGEKGPEWRSGIIEITKVSGEGVGSRYKQTVRGPGGRAVAADYTITEFTPNSVLAFQATAGPVRPRGRYELAEVDGSTTVTFSLDADLAGIKKFFMGGMVAKTMTAEVQALDKAKAVLET